MISRNKQIKFGAMLSYFGIAFGIITGLLYNPWMIAQIGKSDYALYTLALSLINTFLLDFGLSMASQRFISKYRAENNQQEINNTVGLIFKLYLLITVVLLVIFSVLYFFIDSIYVKLTPSELEKFRVLYIMVAIYSVTSFPFVTLNGILSAYEKFVPLKLCELLYKIISIGLTVIALFIGYGVYILVVVNLFASILVTIIRILFIVKTIPIKPNFKYKNVAKVKELFSFSLWTAISTTTMHLVISLSPSILGMVADSTQIAIFGYAISIEGYVYTFINAINGFFMPELSRISACRDKENGSEQVLKLMTSVGRFILLLFVLIFVGFIAMGQDFIGLLVGGEFNDAYYCVLLVCGYGFFAYPQQIANTYTVVQNKVKQRAIASLVAFALFVGLSFAFGSMWGSFGIASAICVSLVVQTILYNFIYYKLLKINIFKFFRDCHLKSLPGILFFAGLSIAIRYIPIWGWLGFALKVALICLTFVVVIWFIILNKEEKNNLIGKFKKRQKNREGDNHE